MGASGGGRGGRRRRSSGGSSIIRKELVLQNQRQNTMENDHKDQNNLCNLRLGTLQDRVHVPNQKHTRDTRTNAQQDPSSQLNWDHRQHRHGDPDRKRIPIKSKHFKEIRLASEILCGTPDEEGDQESVGVDGAECKCHLEDVILVRRSIEIRVDRVHNRRCHKQHKNHCRRNPERPCEVVMVEWT